MEAAGIGRQNGNGHVTRWRNLSPASRTVFKIGQHLTVKIQLAALEAFYLYIHSYTYHNIFLHGVSQSLTRI
jgi:hypothetical protein